MKKYQELEKKVEEIQKEIERLKKEEEEENELPPWFKRAYAIKLLKTHQPSKYLFAAFDWEFTPQGFGYWNGIHKGLLKGNGNLDDEVIIQIQKWIILSYEKEFGM